MSGAGPDLFQLFFDVRCEIRVIQGDVVQTDDDVHGRTDLMAHIGQETRLGTVRVLRLIQCFLEHPPLVFLCTDGFLNIVNTQKDPAGLRPYADRNDFNLIGRAVPFLIHEPEVVVQRMLLRHMPHYAFLIHASVKGFIFLFIHMAEPVKKSGEGAIAVQLRAMIQITVIRAQHRKGVAVYIRAD